MLVYLKCWLVVLFFISISQIFSFGQLNCLVDLRKTASKGLGIFTGEKSDNKNCKQASDKFTLMKNEMSETIEKHTYHWYIPKAFIWIMIDFSKEKCRTIFFVRACTTYLEATIFYTTNLQRRLRSEVFLLFSENMSPSKQLCC